MSPYMLLPVGRYIMLVGGHGIYGPVFCGELEEVESARIPPADLPDDGPV